MTKAGADEDELMQKLMAMIGGGAASGGRPLKGQMVAKENAIKGRDSEMRVTEEHYVLVSGWRCGFFLVDVLHTHKKKE